MAVPVVVARKRATDPGGATDITISLTSGWDTDYSIGTFAPATNDIVVPLWAVDGLSNVAPTIMTSGYTAFGSLYEDDTFDANLAGALKKMGATPDTSVKLSATQTTSNEGAYEIVVIRGVDPTQPLDVAIVPAGGINGGRPTPGPITPVTPDSLIMCAAANAYSSVSVFTNSDLDDFESIATNGSDDVSLGVGFRTWGGGTETFAQWLGGATSAQASWNSYTVAFRPAVVPSVGGNVSTQWF